MVAQKIHIPGAQEPASIETEIVLKPVRIYHEDGATETAYVQQEAADDKSKAISLHNRLTIVYMSVAIIALTISAIVALHKMKNS